MNLSIFELDILNDFIHISFLIIKKSEISLRTLTIECDSPVEF